MQYGLITESIVPLRRTPSESAEMTNQLLFGESVSILRRYENWFEISNHYDGYTGWLDTKMVSGITTSQLDTWNKTKSVITEKQYPVTKTDGTVVHLPCGAEIGVFTGTEINLANLPKQQTNSFKDTQHWLNHLVNIFMNTPYLWGGKTPFGIDCSAFVQIAFKLKKVLLPRDASQQINDAKGITIKNIAECKLGDVAFFINNSHKIHHVGILLTNTKILHASGRVRIDKIDDTGIFNATINEHTHHLAVIKRF